jgi:hypothetical protein
MEPPKKGGLENREREKGVLFDARIRQGVP